MSRTYWILFASIALVCITVGVLWAVVAMPWQSPEQVLARFYSYTAPEEELMDPLILSGKEIVPMVVSKVIQPDMPRRRYAIGFLGNGRFSEALPVLRNILEDEREKDYVRADALKAIYQIDQQLGIASAKLYADRSDGLGRISQQLLIEPSTATSFRSYLDALLGRPS